MTAGSLDEEAVGDGELEEVGLAEGHAYSLLAAHTINFQGREVKLVKLRNPWGNTEWNRTWKDEDHQWQQVSASDRKRVGFLGPRDDGIFFMEYKDFIHYFDAAQICYYHDGFKYNSITVRSNAGEGKYFKVDLEEGGLHYFSVSQRSVRHLDPNEQDDHEYAKVSLVVSSNQRDAYVDPSSQ